MNDEIIKNVLSITVMVLTILSSILAIWFSLRKLIKEEFTKMEKMGANRKEETKVMFKVLKGILRKLRGEKINGDFDILIEMLDNQILNNVE